MLGRWSQRVAKNLEGHDYGLVQGNSLCIWEQTMFFCLFHLESCKQCAAKNNVYFPKYSYKKYNAECPILSTNYLQIIKEFNFLYHVGEKIWQ